MTPQATGKFSREVWRATTVMEKKKKKKRRFPGKLPSQEKGGGEERVKR